MPATYEPIASQTVSNTTTATVTFDNIPSGFTDLELVMAWSSQSTSTNLVMTLNNDTSSLYSSSWLQGNGSVAASARESGKANWSAGLAYTGTGVNAELLPTHVTLLSYANTNVNKTALWRFANQQGSGSDLAVVRGVGLYRSTTAISRIDLKCSGAANHKNGSTFALYGVKAA